MVPDTDRKLGLALSILEAIAVFVAAYGVFSFGFESRQTSSEAPGLIFACCLAVLIVAIPNSVGWAIVGLGRRLGYRFLAAANALLAVLYLAGLSIRFGFPLFVLAFVGGFAILCEWRYRDLQKLHIQT